MLSHIRLSSVCLSVFVSVVCNVCASHLAGWNFRQSFSAILHFISQSQQPSADLHAKVYEDRPGESPPSKAITQEGSKNSDFGPVEGYISETVQDRRWVSSNH